MEVGQWKWSQGEALFKASRFDLFVLCFFVENLWVSALVETKVAKLSIMVSFDYQHDQANKCLT